MLSAIPNLTIDNLLIIFTMIDRHDPDSRWARYWASLPAAFYTGLTFPGELVSSLSGTAGALELTRAQSHLRLQYEATQPLFAMLLAAYPQLLQADWFTYAAYCWAAELWYSYAFEIEFPGDAADATSTPVMVPFDCHINHSPAPHGVRYGRVDDHDRLNFRAFRPCAQGEQAFISYGPVPILKLLCYYVREGGW